MGGAHDGQKLFEDSTGFVSAAGGIVIAPTRLRMRKNRLSMSTSVRRLDGQRVDRNLTLLDSPSLISIVAA